MPVESSPTLHAAVLYPAALVLLLLQLVVLWRVKDNAARFVITAIWLRTMMSAFHNITYEPLFAGLSWNALASLGVIAVGLWIAGPRAWRLKALAPVYLILAVLVASGVVNQQWTGLFSSTLKWLYYLVILVCAYQAVLRMGQAGFCGWLLCAFAPPILFQILSVITGVSKQGMEDGSPSFIGGYDHEAAFSVVLLAGLWTVTFATRLPDWIRHALALTIAAGVYLALYRTSIIAAAPILAAYVAFAAASVFRREDRGAVMALTASIAVFAIGAGAFILRDRFADFVTVATHADVLRPPEQFTAADRELFSGRLYIWSEYLTAYTHGGLMVWILGFGPEAWDGVFRVYAHNSFVSALYETGVIGALSLLFLWIAMASQTLRVRDAGVRMLLLAGHVSMLLANMATMGHWLIEGMIFYALVCGFTLAHALVAEPLPLRRRPAAMPVPTDRPMIVAPARWRRE